ncbi:MAG: dynamin family protein [Lachnospiraceae bacterium]|nr:dynamin family protein [Lachnospiraceae bacterium]
MMEEQGYTSYHGMVAEVNTAMTELSKLCGQLEMEENQRSIDQSRKKLAEHKFSVGIMGEFKRGKSTVINALLGAEIMPADILPCTATMNRVTYDLTPHAQVISSDGSAIDVPVDQIKDYVTKLNEESDKRSESVDEAIVYYPCKFCQNGVDIVDTPGLNDDDRMDRISEQVIPKLDAVIMVVVPGAPFGKSEADFVRNKLVGSDLGRLIFLVNKIDTIRPKERERCVQDIRNRIQTAVLDKMAEVYGNGSKEYQDAKAKLGSIRIFPISAADALDGRLEGNQELITESGIVAFEKELTYMLTVERGALELAAPLSNLLRTSEEVIQAAETRKNSLSLSGDTFRLKQQEALERINRLRNDKRAENKKIKAAGQEIRVSLLPQAAEFYQELEKKLYDAIDQVKIDEKTLALDAGKAAAAQRIEEAVQSTLQEQMSYFCERMKSKVMESLGKEASRLTDFTSKMGMDTQQIRMDLSGMTSKKSNGLMMDIASITIDTLTNSFGILGLSGAFKGYQLAGGKGAAVGLGVGVATAFGVAAIAGPLGVVGLPLCLIAGIASQKTGGMAVKKLFGGNINHKAYLEIVDTLRDKVKNMVVSLRQERQLERYIEKLVDEGFGHLSAVMEEECEKLLKDTEQTIDSIKRDLTKNEMQKEQESKRYDAVIVSVNQIMKQLLPMLEKVNSSRSEA